MCLYNVSLSNAIDKVVIQISMKPLLVKSINGFFFSMGFFQWLKAWSLTNLGSDLTGILTSYVNLGQVT